MANSRLIEQIVSSFEVAAESTETRKWLTCAYLVALDAKRIYADCDGTHPDESTMDFIIANKLCFCKLRGLLMVCRSTDLAEIRIEVSKLKEQGSFYLFVSLDRFCNMSGFFGEKHLDAYTVSYLGYDDEDDVHYCVARVSVDKIKYTYETQQELLSKLTSMRIFSDKVNVPISVVYTYTDVEGKEGPELAGVPPFKL